MALAGARWWAAILPILACAFAVPADAAAPAPAASRLQPVDLELVLATDTSTSIDEEEAMLQRQGVADAFKSPEIVRAIQSGALGRIAVAYVDWSGPALTHVVLDWRIVRDKASAEAFADALLNSPPPNGRFTAIGEALAFAAALIEANNYEGTEKTIDISGDGPSNQGRPVAEARDEITARGIGINGLPIVTGDYGTGEWGIYYGELEKYYANCVIGGPGSFALPAKGFRDFAAAIRRKLVLELSQRQSAPKNVIKVAAVVPAPPQPGQLVRPDPGVTKEQARMNCSGGGPNRGFRGFGRFGQ